MPITFESLKELTLERNLMDVSNVEKCSPAPLPLKDIKEVTLERKATYISNFQ
jgi:hypothetical protein